MNVYLIAKSTPITSGLLKWFGETRPHLPKDSLSDTSSEKIVEYAGRVCYDSFATPRPGGTRAYLEHIISSGHGSVLEHVSYTFAITGISRVCTHELVRHRAGFAFSQRSQRYCDESETDFIFDPIDGLPVEIVEGMERLWNLSREVYQLLESHLSSSGLSRKASRSLARYVLPQATSTEIVVTANTRAWRHFVETRGSRHADREIRLLANKILASLKEDSPNIFGDYVTEDLGDGTCEITTENKKV